MKVPGINFVEICVMGAAVMHADRRTDMTKILTPFASMRTRLKWIILK
jgi:hypothetical protein